MAVEGTPPVARYDAFAQYYDEWIAPPEDDLVARSLLDRIGSVSCQRILDLGCGQGRIARTLAAAGNTVVGVDLSRELLDIARRDSTDGIDYVLADATTSTWWDGTPFDGVVSSMALMDIDDLDGAVATAAATVRGGGWFAWSIIHPGFPGVGEVRASWPTDGGYFDERLWNTGGAGLRGRVDSNHRTLATYLNTVTRAGFVLEEVDEPRWHPTDDAPPMPFFLITRWRRIGGSASGEGRR